MSRGSTRTSTSPTRCSSTRSHPVILGIDPGTTGMGYAFLVAGSDRATLVECGLVDVRASTSAAERLLAISEALDALIRRHHPTALAVERLFFNKRSEEHTSELQSRGHLVCRLLLEKKK